MNSDSKKIGLVIHPNELDEFWMKTLIGCKIPLLGIHPTGGETAAQSLEQMVDLYQTPQFQQKLAMLEAHGTTVEFCCHALSFLLPRTQFLTHPQWFRMDEAGNRNPDVNCCPSNPDALARLADGAAELARQLPAHNHRYHFWLDDAHVGGCCCARCKSISRADQALMLVHAILHGLQRTDPQAKLCYLAYHDTLQAPVLKPEKGVFLEYAPMDRDYERPLNDPDCAKNAAQLAPLQGLLQIFGTQDATALDYWMDNSLFSGWTKPPKAFLPHLQTAAADGRLYASLGFEAITTFACYLGADYRELHGTPPIEEFVRELQKVV